MSIYTTDNALGIYQSDIIFHSALVEAIADLRRNPWLLDYVFSGLVHDPLTQQQYGKKQIDLAKNYFLKTNFPVVMNLHAEGVVYPCFSIALVSCDECENTLADVHYTVAEDCDDNWPVLYGPFIPQNYTYSTGTMDLPDDIVSQLVVAPGMVVVDKKGNSYPIQDVTDNQAIILTAGTVGDFNGATIKGQRPTQALQLESCNFRENFSIGVHVTDDGKGTTLSWLFSILKFILLRYRQSLFESRGFERTTLNFSPPKMEIEGEGGEQRFLSRYANITGYARDVWPKLLVPKFTSTSLLIQESAVNDTLDSSLVEVTDQDPNLFDSLGNPLVP